MLDIASSAVKIGSRLIVSTENYRKKKATKENLMNAFETEVNFYMDTCDEALKVTQEIIPLFEKIGKEITYHDTKEICKAYIPVPRIIADLVCAFVNFAKACTEISNFQGFMTDLWEYDKISFDFIKMMKKAYFPKENKAVIDGEYYRFFQLYKNKLLKDVEIKPGEMDEAFEEIQPVLDKVKRLLKFMNQTKNKTVLATKETRKKINRNFKRLAIKTQRLEIKEQANNRLNGFFPKQFLSIDYFYERLDLPEFESGNSVL